MATGVLTYSVIGGIQRQSLIERCDQTFLAMYTTGLKDANNQARALTFRAINRFTTLPVPTGENWIHECTEDPDISRLVKTLKNKTTIDRTKLQNSVYWNKFIKQGKLEVENDILYQFEEPKAFPMRRLRRAVVPHKLRSVITQHQWRDM